GADASPDAGDTASESETVTQSSGDADADIETDTVRDAGEDAGWDASLDAGASCAGFPDMTHCTLVTDPDRKYDVCVDERCVSPGCGDAGCNVPGAHYRLPPDVGHDAFERTTDDEPVVTDKITKLVWQGCPAGLTGPSCGTGAAVSMVWEDAVYYCDGLKYHGHADWRLPNIKELMSIVDDRRFDPAFDPDLFPALEGGDAWSSTGFWYVDEVSGSMSNYQYYYRNVLCVRTGK
ncbi:MAG: DUF1566 domain-containing protein, partial [Deltaproteobacteria bacterium]|nr:DUF1566 domain-containing protein [Deltaproteobacteria bacterium]